ncbi:MAG: tetratricopeptide repeat protein, partial [Bacteroidetes bacterium]|nr:tetratricopeptide repeat protein [Bacteroidota bacterium]
MTLTLFSYSYAKAQTSIQLIPSGHWLDEGDKLNDSSRYKDAIEAFRHVDRSDTNYVRSLYGIAVSYMADSQYDAAAEYCRMALSSHADPEMETAIWNEYANALDAAEKYDAAIRAYDSAIARYPSFALVYMNKGTSFLKQQRYEEAE